jgi:flagellar hook protein FlgE
MSLYGSMYTGISGVHGNTQRFSTISDNISNVNTTGYKAARTSFSDLVVGAGAKHSYIPGGVRSTIEHEVSRQGQIQSTASATDMAINGNGFFIVKDSTTSLLPGYTRAGSFSVDSEGFLRNTAGQYLQAFPLDSAGNLPSDTSMTGTTNVNVTQVVGSATPTSTIGLTLNLPADAGTKHATSPLTTSLTVYDSLGTAHKIAIDWTSADAASGTWTGTVTQDGTIPAGTISATFNPDGTFQTTGLDDGTREIDLDLTGSFGNPVGGQTMTLNLANITSFAGEYEVSTINQNGSPVGKLAGVSITDSGTVELSFTNGTTRSAYKIPLATFPNVDGLSSESGGVFRQSIDSGLPSTVLAKTAGAGSLISESLESSTVDIAQELTDMILTQNAYSSNVKVITTADQMMQELNRIKS